MSLAATDNAKTARARTRAYLASRGFEALAAAVLEVRDWPRENRTPDERRADRAVEAVREKLDRAEYRNRELIGKRITQNGYLDLSDRAEFDIINRATVDLAREGTLARIHRTGAREAGALVRSTEAKARFVRLRAEIITPAIIELVGLVEALRSPAAASVTHAAVTSAPWIAQRLALVGAELEIDFPKTPATDTEDLLERIRCGRHIAAATSSLLQALQAWTVSYCAPGAGLAWHGWGAGASSVTALAHVSQMLAGTSPSTAPARILDGWQEFTGSLNDANRPRPAPLVVGG